MLMLDVDSLGSLTAELEKQCLGRYPSTTVQLATPLG